MSADTLVDPAAGDLEGIRRRIALLRDRGDHAAAMGDALPRTADSTADFWSGSARETWCESLMQTALEWRVLHGRAESEVASLRRYVAAVESIADRVAAAEGRIDDASDELAGGVSASARELEEASLTAATRALQALGTERHEADALLVRELGDLQGMCVQARSMRLPSAAALHEASPRELLDVIGALAPGDLSRLLSRDPAIIDQLATADPSVIANWWRSQPRHQMLIDLVPEIVGSLDGVPAADRVAANRLVAERRIASDEAALLGLTVSEGVGGATTPGRARVDAVKSEIAYLRRVVAGDVQLYLYDPDASRIVEMIGTPSADTKHVITYVPGTFTSLESFSGQRVQGISHRLVDVSLESTVAFVYKDGRFPGENDSNGSVNMARIVEANNQATGLQAGRTLARFQSGIRASGLDTQDSIAIGHSWGLAAITSSEVAGAHYSKVISLSGAWVPDEWTRRTSTAYYDLSYNDILQTAGRSHVLTARPPRTAPGFLAFSFFDGPSTMNGAQLHDLITQVSPANDAALDKLRNIVFQ